MMTQDEEKYINNQASNIYNNCSQISQNNRL